MLTERNIKQIKQYALLTVAGTSSILLSLFFFVMAIFFGLDKEDVEITNPGVATVAFISGSIFFLIFATVSVICLVRCRNFAVSGRYRVIADKINSARFKQRKNTDSEQEHTKDLSSYHNRKEVALMPLYVQFKEMSITAGFKLPEPVIIFAASIGATVLLMTLYVIILIIIGSFFLSNAKQKIVATDNLILDRFQTVGLVCFYGEGFDPTTGTFNAKDIKYRKDSTLQHLMFVRFKPGSPHTWGEQIYSSGITVDNEGVISGATFVYYIDSSLTGEENLATAEAFFKENYNLIIRSDLPYSSKDLHKLYENSPCFEEAFLEVYQTPDADQGFSARLFDSPTVAFIYTGSEIIFETPMMHYDKKYPVISPP